MSDYKVHTAWIEEASFEALIIEIPKEELEDKLAELASEKGNITKSFFEDFIIVSCVANVNQLLFHVKQLTMDMAVIVSIRDAVMKKIFEVNPLLAPDNLVLNKNMVVKLKSGDLSEGEKLLVDNKIWASSQYEDLVDALYNEGPSEEEYKLIEEKLNKNPNDMEHVIERVWWERINKYIDIKKFGTTEATIILGQRSFHNRLSFQNYIVSVCVIDAEDLFVMLDEMGITQHTAPNVLMSEIYKLCKDINPTLVYENVKDDSIDLDDADIPSRGPMNKMAHSAQQNRKKKINKKTFKDVPREVLMKLGDNIKLFVIGQDTAIDHIVESVQRASVGLKEPERPIGSFLFAGRTGCGKTLTTKVLADELIQDRKNLITIDCSEYSADHEYAKLIGSPNGYIGHDNGGYLTNAVTENPFSVVVFDEIEKASRKVHELMLQILEEGRLTDGKGNRVSFKNCIIIMTSNVGVTEVDNVKKTVGFGDVAKLTEDKKTKAIDKAVKDKFKPEFLNRIDAIIHFNMLKKDDYMRIIELELHKLNENLKNNDTDYRNVKLTFDNKVRDFIYKNGINEDFGARPLKRCIEKEISTPLASRLLHGEFAMDAEIKVSLKRNKVDFNLEENYLKQALLECEGNECL